jgi:branched-chain amino acid transport system permease protein
MADFVQTLETAIAVGSLYALIALGYTMVYGILKFINFAHGDIVALGAWISFKLARQILNWMGPAESHPWWVGAVVLVLAMLFCGVLGFLIERLAYRPLRNAPRLNVLITAIGVSLLLQTVGQMPWAFGKSLERMPELIPNVSLIRIPFGEDSVSVSLVDGVIVATAGALMFGLEYVVYRTRFGAAMRAVSFNPSTAALMGIPVDRVVSMTFVGGSMLAAAAGFLFAMKYPGINQPAHTTWVLLGLKAFVAAVIGGIGNVRGALLGGFVIAFVEQFGAHYVSSNLKDVYVFTLLILILLVRPTGLLGSTVQEKV